jgi:hypothetical protein
LIGRVLPITAFLARRKDDEQTKDSQYTRVNPFHLFCGKIPNLKNMIFEYRKEKVQPSEKNSHWLIFIITDIKQLDSGGLPAN